MRADALRFISSYDGLELQETVSRFN